MDDLDVNLWQSSKSTCWEICYHLPRPPFISPGHIKVVGGRNRSCLNSFKVPLAELPISVFMTSVRRQLPGNICMYCARVPFSRVSQGPGCRLTSAITERIETIGRFKSPLPPHPPPSSPSSPPSHTQTHDTEPLNYLFVSPLYGAFKTRSH